MPVNECIDAAYVYCGVQVLLFIDLVDQDIVISVLIHYPEGTLNASKQLPANTTNDFDKLMAVLMY